MKWPFVLRSTMSAEIESVVRAAQADVRSAEVDADTWRIRAGDCGRSLAFLQGQTERMVAERDVLTETIATLREQKVAAAAAIDRLTTERDKARTELTNATTALAGQLETKAPKRSKLTQAIRDNARMPDGTIDRRLVNHFRAEANKQLNKNVKEEDVIASLSQWQTTENANQITADRMADLADEAIV